jgi:AMMECR1 domain-containing protein
MYKVKGLKLSVCCRTDGVKPSKMPEDICLNQDHVGYAFAVLKGKFHDQPAEVCFEDSDCPAGRVYIVKITWEKPRPAGAGGGALPDRECRGSSWKQATRLSSAIAAAALHIDQRFPPEIQSEDLHELVCTVSLIRRHEDIVPVGQHATSTMCLSLVEPNPEQSVVQNLDKSYFMPCP